MRNKKTKIIITLVILTAVVSGVLIFKFRHANSDSEVTKEITLFFGTIQNTVSTTGTVLPKNRLEVKPPVNGRIEEILVAEGEKVKAGQTLAWMSSTERAALLDAARGQGEKPLEYWKEVYKPIALISPIDGEVIVATTQPGQTITTNDPVLVLSDHLIVRAQVDETDIGKVKPDMKAIIALDAYPDKKIKACVEHIYYESQTVNNVTIYQVDLLPEEVPPFFRSGMNASVDFIIQGKDNAMLIPQEAAQNDQEGDYVFVKQANARAPLKVKVKLGILDDKNVEVLSGINEKDTIIVKAKKYSLPKNNAGSNPFMPQRRRQ